MITKAIARAVYARPSIIILDDVLSALDAKTEAHVAEQLLGENGIFRRFGTTVVLITHASTFKSFVSAAINLTDVTIAQHLPLADQIIVLAESKIAEKGTWNELRSSTGYVSKLEVKESNASSAKNAAAEKMPTVPGTTAPSNTDLMDLTRKTGDASVYCKLKSFVRPGYFIC
jgi:ATP-binding cassette, subfamily C (CFTR/MRP), member 1